MKRNNKGFFLAETLIVISLVTLILAFVYPNLSKLYETFVLKTNYYDQVQDIQALKSIDFVFNSNIEAACYHLEDGEYKAIEKDKLVSLRSTISIDGLNNMNLEELYITNYDTSSSDDIDDYSFTRYLKRIRKNKLLPNACRLIGKFRDSDEYDDIDGSYVGEYRFASVEHGIAIEQDDKYVLKYTDSLTGIRPFVEGIIPEEGQDSSGKNDEKLYMIIGDDRVYNMLSSIRNIEDGFYCNPKKDDENNPISTINVDKINTVDTYSNNCSFYYFMPSDSSNYKIHIFSTMGQSSLAVENQIDVVKSLLNKYENNTAIKKENINIMLVYGTNYVLENSETETLKIIKNKLIDTGVLDGINYKISTIPAININSYNSCMSKTIDSDFNSYNSVLRSLYSDKIYNLTFTPEYETCKPAAKDGEQAIISGYHYKDNSNIKLFELYINGLKGE